MWITTYFQNPVGPVTGLLPIIKVTNINTDALVVSGTMTELGDGFYAYDYTSYDIEEEYAIFCDAVTLQPPFRYKYLSSGEYGDIIDTVGVLSDNIEIRTLLIKKILTNRLELNDGDTANLVLYDDDSSTVLGTWDVTDSSDGPILQDKYSDAKRTKGQ